MKFLSLWFEYSTQFLVGEALTYREILGCMLLMIGKDCPLILSTDIQ